MNAIEIAGLSKSYRVGTLGSARRTALRDLSLTVPAGEIFGYLGPNGSGKTTTLKVIMGLIFADAGTIRVLGVPLEDPSWRARAGYMPENPYLYDYLTPAEYLDYVGRLFGLATPTRRERSGRLLDLVGLGAWAKTPLRRFSKGMLQRAGIAQALMNEPDIVFLDEPMSGLDPIGRRLMRNILLDLRSSGKTVFFSTHILSDAENLCDSVAVLAAGRLLRAGRIDEILNVDVSHFEVLTSGLAGNALGELPASARVRAIGDRCEIAVPEDGLHLVLGAVGKGGGRVLAVNPVRQSLEDYFVDQVRDHGGAEPTWTAD